MHVFQMQNNVWYIKKYIIIFGGKISWRFILSLFFQTTVHYIHLADAFIQSDLHWHTRGSLGLSALLKDTLVVVFPGGFEFMTYWSPGRRSTH